jgi:hypothetical protein
MTSCDQTGATSWLIPLCVDPDTADGNNVHLLAYSHLTALPGLLRFHKKAVT